MTRRGTWLAVVSVLVSALLVPAGDTAGGRADRLTIRWEKNFLRIRGDKLPGGEIEINYLEAYCRPGSTDRDWRDTVIGFVNVLLPLGDAGFRSDVIPLAGVEASF